MTVPSSSMLSIASRSGFQPTPSSRIGVTGDRTTTLPVSGV